MNDCANATVRDRLPDYLHETLSEQARDAVDAHLQECADCRAELTILEAVLRASSVAAVPLSGVVAAIAPYRSRRVRFASGTLVRIAAAIAIIAVGGTSYSVVSRSGGDGAAVAESLAALALGDSRSADQQLGADPLAVAPDVRALDDQALEELLARLEEVDAVISTEPRPLFRVPIISSGDLE